MSEKDPALPLWASTAFIVIMIVAAIMLLDSMKAVGEADAEALAFDSMRNAGLPMEDLCKQAGRAHRAYTRISAQMQMEQWAMIERYACDSAATCRGLIGGCAQ